MRHPNFWVFPCRLGIIADFYAIEIVYLTNVASELESADLSSQQLWTRLLRTQSRDFKGRLTLAEFSNLFEKSFEMLPSDDDK